jgi:hypothetical protein
MGISGETNPHQEAGSHCLIRRQCFSQEIILSLSSLSEGCFSTQRTNVHVGKTLQLC